MRLKNKFFLEKVKNKIDFKENNILFLHLENNIFFKEFQLYCLENNILFFKSRNSLLKNFIKGKKSMDFILKSSTFLVIFKDLKELFNFISFLEKFQKRNKSLILLCFFYSLKLYSIKKLFLLKKKLKNKMDSFFLISTFQIFFCKRLKMLFNFINIRLRLIKILKFNANN